MKHPLLPLILIGATASLGLADAASAATVHGTVIKREAHASVIALKSGKLLTVRGASARLGSVVTVRGSRKRSAITALSMRVTGQAKHAKVHGIVVRRAGHRFLLADQGPSVAVMTPTTTPPAPGSEVTTSVTIGAGSLEQDDDASVDAEHADGAEFSGAVATVTPQVLTLSVNGVMVPIQVGAIVLPTGLAQGQRVEVKVTLAQAAGGAITYNLVRIHVEGIEDTSGDHHGHCAEIEAKGTLALGQGTITVTTADAGTVTFTVPAGFSLAGLTDGATVEAKGSANADGTVTLVRVELADSGDDNQDEGHDGHGHSHGDGGSGEQG